MGLRCVDSGSSGFGDGLGRESQLAKVLRSWPQPTTHGSAFSSFHGGAWARRNHIANQAGRILL